MKSDTYIDMSETPTLSLTQYMLLSMLVQRPRTAYELGRLSRPPANLIWAVKLSQLYPELAGLADLGLVEFERSGGRGPLDKKTYSVTAAGRAVLKGFMLAEPPKETQRNPLVLLALATTSLSSAEAAAVWQREAVRLQADADALRERWDRNRLVYDRVAVPEPPDPAFGPWCALELAARQRDAEAAVARALAATYADAAGGAARPPLPGEDEPALLNPLQRMLLTLLAIRPRTGYDFTNLNKAPANLIWPVALSQIYPTLGKLAAMSFADCTTSSGRGPLEKKTYTITAAGREALRHDLLLPAAPDASRCLLSIWAHGSWLLEPADAARVWQERAAALEADCAALTRRESEVHAQYGTRPDEPPDGAGFCTAALYRFVMARRRAELDFARELADRYAAAARRPAAAAD